VTQEGFLLLAVAILGVYAIGWARRLAPGWSELPLKTLMATALAGTVAFLELSGAGVAPTLRWLALVAGPVYVFAPLAVTAAARARAYALGDRITALLYWTADGRDAVRRLLVQAALQQGDADAALERLPEREGEVMRAQALAARGDWDAVLAVPLPDEGEATFLGIGARVEALLAQDRIEAALAELQRMRDRWERGARGPIGFRSLALAEARVEAERGNLRRVRELMGQPLPGVPADVLYAIVGRAALRAGDTPTAMRLYAEAYRHAPEGRRERSEAALRAHGQALPRPLRRRLAGGATLSLAGALALAFVGQLLLDRVVGTLGVGRFALDASSVAAAFALGIPGFPEAGAWWRFLSYAFVHGGLVHVGFNLWVLVDIGRIYETRRGWGSLLAAFVAGTAMGSYLTGLAQAGQTVLLVGASGGVLGVAGALLADVLRSRDASDRVLLRGLAQWMVLIALLSVVVPNVSLWGHVGGVVGGVLWGFVRQGLPRDSRVDVVAGVLAAVALALAAGQVLRVAAGLL
jgi:rhomboid protease GluP